MQILTDMRMTKVKPQIQEFYSNTLQILRGNVDLTIETISWPG
jgi:hypothetical protein